MVKNYLGLKCSNTHFNPTGKWYIENSLTTVNKQDPVSEYNTSLWNTGLESDKETARKQKESWNTTQTFM